MNVSRRDVMIGLGGALAASGWAKATKRLGPVASLVPAELCKAPNYWCTWGVQNYMYGQGFTSLDPRLLEDHSGAVHSEEQITEANLFGKGEWLEKFHARARSELYVLMDEGWESGGYASFDPDVRKFPSLKGTTVERITRLNSRVKDSGWRALALWCRDTPGGEADKQLVSRSTQAGIPYWKIDGGDKDFNVSHMRDLTHSPLILEHVHPEGPLNGTWKEDGRFGALTVDSPRFQMLRRADVYRTYDTSTTLSVPTTLDRISELLLVSVGHPEVTAILNCEDEVYIAAALGCTMGIMRHPLRGLRPSPDVDIAFAGPRQTKRRMDEVVRAIRWQRIASPYPVSEGFFRRSPEVLTDDWKFLRGDTWFEESIDQVARQGAPAILSRNLELPAVKSSGERPFIVTGRFPNGAAAIATLQRTHAPNRWYTPAADVTWNVGSAQGPYGVFGRFKTLTLTFSQSVKGVRVLAQDLSGELATDITSHVEIERNAITLSGTLIEHVGLSAATAGDLSDPGLVIRFG